jgi:hypothetical protein
VDAEIVEGSAALFARVHAATGGVPDDARWFHHAALPDGARYLRWSGLFEFLVAADGRRIACRPLDRAVAAMAFETYLLGQVLSFSLLRLGLEHLHSTSVVVDGGAVGFLGDCGYGKSTLGAAFVQAGYPLLTDDLLVLKHTRHRFTAYPGPARIKLFPEAAQGLLGDGIGGVPMNGLTPKLVIALGRDGRSWWGPAPLRAIYVLPAPTRTPRTDRVTIRTLSPRRAFVELTRNTFNAMVLEPARLARQFDLVARLATAVPVKALAFPRTLERLAAVREAIEADLAA